MASFLGMFPILYEYTYRFCIWKKMVGWRGSVSYIIVSSKLLSVIEIATISSMICSRGTCHCRLVLAKHCFPEHFSRFCTSEHFKASCIKFSKLCLLHLMFYENTNMLKALAFSKHVLWDQGEPSRNTFCPTCRGDQSEPSQNTFCPTCRRDQSEPSQNTFCPTCGRDQT